MPFSDWLQKLAQNNVCTTRQIIHLLLHFTALNLRSLIEISAATECLFREKEVISGYLEKISQSLTLVRATKHFFCGEIKVE